MKFAPLPDKLIDGEDDYLIEITEQGLEFMIASKTFQYRDMDL